MRTTVDLPEDLHTMVVNLARDSNRSISATIADIVERQLATAGRPQLIEDPDSGLLLIDIGKPTTTEDVRSLEDEW